MTAPVKVLVDSTAGISPELARKWDVGIVPLYLEWEERTYRDGVELLPAHFYAQLARSATNPKTSAPNPADFVTACRAALAAGHQQICIVTVTPGMSATYASACQASSEIGIETVGVVNSGQGAGAQALVAAYAAGLARRGARLPEIMAATEAACRRTEIFMAVDTLRYLRRGGRISAMRATMGEIIRMKPILTFVDHELHVVARPRTMRRATEWLLDRVTQSGPMAEQILVVYADTPALAEALAGRIRGRLPGIEIDISPVSGVVGGHTGPGLLGLALRRRIAH